jgi:Lon protease-like protein
VLLDALPLFPLPLVLFPGTPLPLHIFEQRYRRLLDDCLGGDRRFGIIRLPDGIAEVEIPVGSIGCVAEIVKSESLADGRSNIIVRGLERFALGGFLDLDRPYHVCRGEAYEDEFEIGAELDDLAERVRDVFQQVGKAARALADDPAPLPDLPSEPSLLSFAIASVIDLDVETRQELLVSRSPTDRLRRLDAVLSPALVALVRHAHVHTLAKTNGRGTHAES